MLDRLAAGTLGALSLLAIVAGWRSMPAMASAGMLLAAAPPAAFVLSRLVADPRALIAHPLLVSATSGLGCVMTLVAQQRFGTPTWTVAAALGGLVVWMLWQRRARRQDSRHSDTMPQGRQRRTKS